MSNVHPLHEILCIRIDAIFLLVIIWYRWYKCIQLTKINMLKRQKIGSNL